MGFDGCSQIAGPATVEADKVVLATLDAPEALVFGNGKRFVITVNGSSIDTKKFGVPAQVPLVVHAVCDGKHVISDTYTVEYVPVLSTIVAPTAVTRFWPADNDGEILACNGDSLVHYDAAGNQIGAALALGFSCTLAEMQGDVGGRRFLTVPSDGMAAIDPGPALVWTRSGSASQFLFEGMWPSATEDIVVEYRTTDPENPGATVAVVALVDRDTGADKFPAITTTYKALSPVTRDAGGNIGVLTHNLEGVETVYYTEYYDSSGAKLRDPVQVSSYAQSTGNPYAEFSFDGSVIYVSATDGGAGNWVQMSALADGTITELTGHGDGWSNVVGGAFGRLLVASDTQFIWVDPSAQTYDGIAFTTDSGTSGFFRLRVEADGSTVMLGDPNSNSGADGFYGFDPQGNDIIRLHGGGSFSWLTESDGGGSLVGLQDGSGDIQEIASAAAFKAQQ